MGMYFKWDWKAKINTILEKYWNELGIRITKIIRKIICVVYRWTQGSNGGLRIFRNQVTHSFLILKN